MQTVYAHMGISLDGYVTGPNNGPGNIGGDGWARLHHWVYGLAAWRERLGMEGGRTDGDNDRVARFFARNGAVVMGRTMFDHGEEPWGPNPPFRCPVFVVTHHDREPPIREGGTTFTFVLDGIEAALERARAAAGDEDVEIAGGGDVVQQYLLAGLLDELELHIAPTFLGGGRALFDRPELAGVRLEPVEAAGSPGVTHVRYRVVRTS